jgi:hypothetical protein
MFPRLLAFASVAITACGCAGVDCEQCRPPTTGFEIIAAGRSVREIRFGTGACSDARVSRSVSDWQPVDAGTYSQPTVQGFAPNAAEYWIDVTRPGECAFDLVLDDGRTFHFSVTMVDFGGQNDDAECHCDGPYLNTLDHKPFDLADAGVPLADAGTD